MLVNWESGPGWEKDSHPMDRTANCCNHGDWVHSGPCSGHHHVIYFSYWRMCGCHVYFPEMVTERGSMVKVPVKCAYFRLLLSSGLLSIPRCQSLSRSLFVSSTCVSQIFLRGVRRERKSPGKFSETNQKKKSDMKELWWSVYCWPILAIGRTQCLICYGDSLGNLSQVFLSSHFLCCCELSCNFTQALLE
jgi:hypothetical protein